jgi:hypothetical protein
VVGLLHSCTHRDNYCASCWKSWVITQINDGSTAIRCPSSGTCALSYEDTRTVLLTGTRKQASWDIFEDRILYHSLITMGCSAGCPRCFSVGWYSQSCCRTVECSQCDYSFCTTCFCASHDGDCGLEGQSNLLGSSDGFSTHTWIRRNTKPCPTCKVRIQKNDGCSHMTCKMCKYEFCWICLGKYKGRHVPSSADKCLCDQ